MLRYGCFFVASITNWVILHVFAFIFSMLVERPFMNLRFDLPAPSESASGKDKEPLLKK